MSAACVNHLDRPSRVNVDGDELCQECADAWARFEGQHAAWLEAQDAEAEDGTAEAELGPRNPQTPTPSLGTQAEQDR